jgi:protein O-GlcNAc transferase
VTALSALWNTAVAHHQAGRLAQAQAAYRAVIAASPRHFDATHMLGVVALQMGELEEAERVMSQALAINSKFAAAHNNLGTVHLRAGRLDAACGSFERAVKLQPGYGDALLNLGNVLRRLGKVQPAVATLRRAVSANANSFQPYSALGAALLDSGDAHGAVRMFEAAAKREPARPDLLNNLANAHLRDGDALAALACCDKALALDGAFVPAVGTRGQALVALDRADEARASFERAVALDSNSAPAHANLGAFLRDSGELSLAIDFVQKALVLDPLLLPAQTSLVHALRDDGRIDDALRIARKAVADHARSSDAHVSLAEALIDHGDLDAAVTTFRLAVTLDAAGADAQLGLANALMAQGLAGEAMQHYQRAVRIDPENARARWAHAMAYLKPIYDDAADMSAARAKFTSAISELDTWFSGARERDGYKVVGSTQPFYLAYQSASNRDVLATYGRLCARLMAAWRDDLTAVPRGRAVGRPVRLGIASAHVRDHSVWNAITRGWVRHIDKQRFEVYIFQLGRVSDAETGRTRSQVKQFVDTPRDLRSWVAAIRNSELDVLIYPEIGMDPLTTRLAAMRLAPLQAATWGHPETTGLPTVDLYLSAEGLEPQDSAAHYTERLVKLPNLGVCCEPLGVAPVTPDLAALGLNDSGPLLLCPGTPFKYTPQHDQVWVDIARRLVHGKLVFFASHRGEMNRQLYDRLRRAFMKGGVDFEARVRIIPTLDRGRFFGLMQRATLMLDTHGFSGFNTALQGIECGLPVVAREGEFMRGRLASGILRRLGLDDLVATSDSAFVDIAVTLAHDDAKALRLRREIEARRPVLFNDLTPVRSLERQLEDALSQARQND